jgi:hypothetical protein
MYLSAKGAFRCVEYYEGHPFDIIPVDKVRAIDIGTKVTKNHINSV